ncbi:kinase-like domain-containing protein [Trichoderma barbatum]
MMSTTTSADLTGIVLLLANFTGVQNIIDLSDNAAFVFKPPSENVGPDAAWLGDLSEAPTPPILCLEFGKNMFSSGGWVGGSAPDTDTADIQLAPDNRTGVSKRHFQIDIHPLTCHPRVKVLSRSLQLLTDGNRLRLAQNNDVEIVSSAIFDLGGIGFHAWRPKLTPVEARVYRQKAMTFSREDLLALPKYFPPLKSAPETITSNVRYGPDNKVYIYQGHSGKGSSASVMLVQERNTGDVFAAKEPYYKLSDDPGTRKRSWEVLKKEYEYILRLDHPYIVKVHDIVFAQDEKEPAWMIEDYIPICLSPKDLDHQSTIVVATQLLSALAHIHSVDIVHRDVKPSNIFMNENTAILGDFGAAQHCVQGNLDTFTGTPIYLAPEFLEEQRNYTNKVDMFSCGMVLLECLSTWDPQSNSRWPSNALNRRMHRQWMRRIVLPHISELPEDIQPLQRGLLRRQPKKRWSALKCLEWLGDYNKASSEECIIQPHINPRDADQETIQPAHIVTPERRANERKRPASAALSDQITRDRARQLHFGEASPLSPDFRWTPSPSPVLRRPPREVPSTLAPGASFVTPPPPLQSPVLREPPSELPSTLAPDLPFVTPPPPSPRVGTALSPNHGLFSYLPNTHDGNRHSFPDASPQSPSWALTPYQYEDEFSVSREDEFSTEDNDQELLKDWEESDSEDKD